MASILKVDRIIDINETGSPDFPNGISIDNNRISGIPGYNYIINGNFDIWQRGTIQTTNGYGSDDRWINVHAGSTKTHSRQTFAMGESFPDGNPTPKYYSRTIVSSAVWEGNCVNKQHKIEYVSSLAGKKATLSFYARAYSNKNIAIEFAQSFGSGGTPSAYVSSIGTQKVSLTTTWQRFVITVDIPSIIGKTLGTHNNDCLILHFWFDAGSNFNPRTSSLGHQSGTFDIACVSLVEGDVDVKPIPRSYGEELALCQRFYETGSSKIYMSGSFSGLTIAYTFKVTKRAAPTMSYSTGSNRGFLPTSTEWTDTESFSVYRTTGDQIAFLWTVDAEL